MAETNTQVIQRTAYENAADTLRSALESVRALQNIVDGLEVPDITTRIADGTTADGFIASRVSINNALAFMPNTPTLASYDGLNAPARPILTAFTHPDIGTIPEFTMVLPTIALPTAPSTDLPGAPGSAPETTLPALPSKPVFSLPTVPTFAPIAIPEPDAIVIPTFDMVMDFGDIVAPTTSFEWSEAEYTSALLDATRAKILNDIQNGGYGIDEDDERRMWDRARERELLNASVKIEELARTHAARGFTLPPGALYAQEADAQQDLQEKNASLSREIAIKRADMYVENRRFAITTAVQIEDMLIRQAGAIAERALNGARAQVELSVAIFNAQVARYTAKLDAFRAYATAFESRVRGALAAAEVFKTKVEAAQLAVETQRLYADVYRIQLDGVNALMGVYRTDMEAAQIAANIEQIKMQGYRTQVEAYAERVRAKAAEFGMFESQIRGETAKVQVYDASVRAYAARLSGIEAKARVADTVSRTEIAQAGAQLDTYRVDMDAYRTQIGIVSEKIKAAIETYQGQLSAYSTFTSAANNSASVSATIYESDSRAKLANAQLLAEQIRAQADKYVQIVQLAMQGDTQSAQILGNISSTWASAVTGLSADLLQT